MLIDIMNDHGLEQLVHFHTREKIHWAVRNSGPLRREIKDDVRKQHDLYVNNLVVDVKANPRDFYRYINSQKKVFRHLKEEEELESQLQKLIRLRNLMVSLRTCSTNMTIVRSHFSVGRSLSWLTLLFQMRV